MNIEIGVDGFKVTGPKTDGTYQVTFTTGEYMRIAVAKLMVLEQSDVNKITIHIPSSDSS